MVSLCSRIDQKLLTMIFEGSHPTDFTLELFLISVLQLLLFCLCMFPKHADFIPIQDLCTRVHFAWNVLPPDLCLAGCHFILQVSAQRQPLQRRLSQIVFLFSYYSTLLHIKKELSAQHSPLLDIFVFNYLLIYYVPPSPVVTLLTETALVHNCIKTI